MTTAQRDFTTWFLTCAGVCDGMRVLVVAAEGGRFLRAEQHGWQSGEFAAIDRDDSAYRRVPSLLIIESRHRLKLSCRRLYALHN